jgi:Protein of unknown function (DUF1566)
VRQRASGGWLPISLFFAALVPLMGCGGDGQGDTCGRAADCGSGLLCVDGGCAPVATTATGGVYIDPVTTLEWQRASAAAAMDWESAVLYCQNLESDGTDWRLPSVDELRSLIRGCPATERGGACGATNTCVTYDVCLGDCAGCEPDAGPAGGCYWPEELEGSCGQGAPGHDVWYWTSTSLDDLVGAWYVVFNYAHVCGRSKDFSYGLVRCVR